MVRKLEIDWGKARRLGTRWERAKRALGLEADPWTNVLVHDVPEEHPVSVFARAAAEKLGAPMPTVHIVRDETDVEKIEAVAFVEMCPKGIDIVDFKRDFSMFVKNGIVPNGIYVSQKVAESLSLGELGAVVGHEVRHLTGMDLAPQENDFDMIYGTKIRLPNYRAELNSDFYGGEIAEVARMKNALVKMNSIGCGEDMVGHGEYHPSTEIRLAALDKFEAALGEAPEGNSVEIQERIIGEMMDRLHAEKDAEDERRRSEIGTGLEL